VFLLGKRRRRLPAKSVGRRGWCWQGQIAEDLSGYANELDMALQSGESMKVHENMWRGDGWLWP
jgi:hypothetical protein